MKPRSLMLGVLGASSALFLAAAACAPASAESSETVDRTQQALGGEDDPCSLADASTAGLQGDCNAGLWCNLKTNKCQSTYLAPGVPVPLPPDGSKEGCTDFAAASACASGACNLAHTACGCLVKEDCSAGESCDQGTFECVGPDAGPADAGGADADAAAPPPTQQGEGPGPDDAGGSQGSASGGGGGPQGEPLRPTSGGSCSHAVPSASPMSGYLALTVMALLGAVGRRRRRGRDCTPSR